VTGRGEMKILVIAEAPGEQEDKQNIQLIGPAGQLLRELFTEYGIDLDKDCRKTNAVRCRPPDNRKPTPEEVKACQPHIWKEIKQNPPKLILLLGQTALGSFLLERMKGIGNIGRWRGLIIPDQKAGCWVCPTFHPSYILRIRKGNSQKRRAKESFSAEELIFRLDIKAALEKVEETFPVMPIPEILPQDQLDFPNMPRDGQVLAIDYETTGLHPYRSGHQIVSTGVCWKDKAIAFPMPFRITRQWKKILADPGVKKIGHNIKFEHQWAQHCLGVETKGWIWDTMQATHILDNRSGICALKLQAYLTLGVPDWSDGVSDDFREDKKGFNHWKYASPDPKLLRYNALDAFYTMAIAKKQMRLFK